MSHIPRHSESVLLTLSEHRHGTRAKPSSSLKEAYLEGDPILKDGASVHMRDAHFQFRSRKAEAVLAWMPILRGSGGPTAMCLLKARKPG
jgi:hypothetical protein